MSVNIEAVLNAAEKLSEEEQLELAARLLESHPADGVEWSLDDPQLGAELKRRAADPGGWKSWNEFRAELDAEE